MTQRHSRTGRSGLIDAMAGHRQFLMRIVARFVRARDVEDVVQEALVRFFIASREQAIKNPRAFMIRTARNLAMDAAKSAERRLSSSLDPVSESGGFELIGEGNSPDKVAAQRERFLLFCKAVVALPKGCRRVFILAKVYEMDQPEIAEHLNISRSTVKKHVAKGMELTTAYMLDHGALVGNQQSPPSSNNERRSSKEKA